ncbi:hypothetical protein Cs7R123_46530 [Catellatospora sp. TT07R-123]|uniref:hypothetical protein n=1 Tax=Catellatospora sp. TT07R-123 TaxID=2733863 RepID=UPI001B0583E4|nr:hypothetical protein [Catellatospora sp. TT07R-123]GHJ47311.1 hypothetical protein Cs7R123_46530 [Catellatospora sp. TT07R-123]
MKRALRHYVKQIGYEADDVTVVPASVSDSHNILQTALDVAPWHTGDTVLGAIEELNQAR